MNTKNYQIINVVEIKGVQYAVVDAGPTYVKGLFAKYLVVPLSSVEGPIQNDVRIYDENT